MRVILAPLLVAGALSAPLCVRAGIHEIPLRRSQPEPTSWQGELSPDSGSDASLPVEGQLLKRSIFLEGIVANTSRVAYGFLGTVTVGTPPQTITNVIFDTGSYYFWVTGSSCSGCASTSKYNPSNSTTYSAAVPATVKESAYLDGTKVSGTFGTDVVSVAGMSVSGLDFMQVTSSTTSTAVSAYVNGIMGLSFTNSSLPKTYWDVLYANKQVDSGIFSYYIDQTDTAGGIIFGGVDRSRITGTIQWVPVWTGCSSLSLLWSAHLISLNGNASYAQEGKGMVILDTGSSVSYASTATASSINKALGFNSILSQGKITVFYISCSSLQQATNLVAMTLKLDGNVSLSLQPDDYARVVNGDRTTICISNLMGVSDMSSSILLLGNAFLKNYVTIFDSANRKMGLAPANRLPAAQVTSNYTVLTAADYAGAANSSYPSTFECSRAVSRSLSLGGGGWLNFVSVVVALGLLLPGASLLS